MTTLDVMGRLLARVRQGTNGSQVVLAQNRYDLAGRLVWSADALGRVLDCRLRNSLVPK